MNFFISNYILFNKLLYLACRGTGQGLKFLKLFFIVFLNFNILIQSSFNILKSKYINEKIKNFYWFSFPIWIS